MPMTAGARAPTTKLIGRARAKGEGTEGSEIGWLDSQLR